MKKFLAVLLAAVALVSAVACGGDKYADLKISNINGFGQNLLKEVTFDRQLDVLDDTEFAAKQLKLDTDKLNLVDGKPEMFYAVSAASPEAVFVIGAKDAAAAKSISSGPIKDWIKFNIEGYNDYGPTHVPKLESCINMTAGRYAFLIVSNDNKAAKDVLTGLLDTSIKIHD